MKLTLQVVIQQGDEPPMVNEIACLEREKLALDTLGLSLQEAKTVLAQLQETLVREQVATAVADLSDGGDNVRDLQFELSPIAEHLLDWFHVTMRITVPRQQLKELVTHAANDDLTKLDARFESIKWYLWHGNAFRALQEIEGVQFELEGYEEERAASTKLAKSVREFYGYIEANQQFIPNYGERYRYGEAIATGFVESTVNQAISKRMVKKQQMRWTKKGAHLLLQVRTQVLNDDLHKTFERWYPAMTKTDVPLQQAA